MSETADDNFEREQLTSSKEIAGMAFEEAVGVAYSYVMQAGLDADEVLANFFEQEDEAPDEQS